MKVRRKPCRIRRLLRLESLESRLVLTAIIPLSKDRSSLDPVGYGSSSQLGTNQQGEPLHGAEDGISRRAMPLYFSMIEEVEPHRFAIVEPNLPAREDDFLFQRARPFELSSGLLNPTTIEANDVLLLNLFHDASYLSVVQRKTTNVNNTTTLVVKLQEYDFAFGYISVTEGDYLVSIDIPEERAYFETRTHPESGSVFLVQLDPNRPDVLDSHEEPLRASEFFDTKPHKRSATESKPEEDKKSEHPRVRSGPPGGSGNLQAQINVMVVYTPAALTWSTNINNTIATALARSNTASINSNLGLSFNLAYSGLVNYTESGSATDLGRLRNQFDGFLDEVHSLRNTHAADMVAILTFTNDTGGIAYLNDTRYGREDLAFSLTRVQQASNTDTFVHELAHNMGAMHSKFQNFQAGPTFWSDWPENNWSAGWRFQGNNGNYYSTVMAYSGGQFYPDGNNATRIPYFSDPNIVFQGQPAGHPVDGDNARSLRELRNYVAYYRDADTLLYCSANGGFNGLGITNVRLGSINQNASYYPFYDFSFASTNIEIGATEQLTVSVTTASTLNQVRVWVDWNDDKDFFDAGELISVSSPNAVLQYAIPVTPPLGTIAGQKRMRIRLHEPNLGGNLSSCGGSTSGKVLDFKLNVTLPSSTIVGGSVYHSAWSGNMGSPVDGLKIVAKESGVPQTLGLQNLINTSQGINGLRFAIDGLPGTLSASDFVFQWSPSGVFAESSNPPASWQVITVPPSINTTAGNPSEVLIQWPDGTIMNRWLRITILATAQTGLAESEVFYVGHLLGETTGPTDGMFTVTFADLAQIRAAVGQAVDSSNVFDLDKNGIVAFSDIASARQNVGAQLPAITVVASGGGGSHGGGAGGELGSDSVGNNGAAPLFRGLSVPEGAIYGGQRRSEEFSSLHRPSLNLGSSHESIRQQQSQTNVWGVQWIGPARSNDSVQPATARTSIYDEAVVQLSEDLLLGRLFSYKFQLIE